jgi:hypothetical protein
VLCRKRPCNLCSKEASLLEVVTTTIRLAGMMKEYNY